MGVRGHKFKLLIGFTKIRFSWEIMPKGECSPPLHPTKKPHTTHQNLSSPEFKRPHRSSGTTRTVIGPVFCLYQANRATKSPVIFTVWLALTVLPPNKKPQVSRSCLISYLSPPGTGHNDLHRRHSGGPEAGLPCLWNCRGAWRRMGLVGQVKRLSAQVRGGCHQINTCLS